MKIYAAHGFKEFVLCLGYKADVIKNYFLQYDECLSNDFVLSKGGKGLKLLASDIQDWRITFVDTGLTSNIGMRMSVMPGARMLMIVVMKLNAAASELTPSWPR
mgnify:CR=1 FL=1